MDFGLSNIPNPATNSIEFLYRIAQQNTEARLVIRDAAGRIVLNKGIDPARNSLQLSLAAFSPGIYYYRIETDKEITQSKKMVIMK